MTSAIVLVAALLSWWVVRQRSVTAAFLDVYLPSLLLLPQYYSLSLGATGLTLSFSQAAILPIGLAICWRGIIKGDWQRRLPSLIDVAVVAFLGWQVTATVYNLETPDRRLVFNLLTWAFLPYVAAKTILEQDGLRVQFARRVVSLIIAAIVISIYEFRMGVSPFRSVIGVLFPGQVVPWFTQIRWGVGRTAGPYGHAISMGIFAGVAYILHRWLHRAGVWEGDDFWERSFSWVRFPRISKGRVFALTLVAGLLMTLSRGPWLGTLGGATVAWAGAQANHRRAFLRALSVIGLAGGLAYVGITTYVAGASPIVGAEEQASAAYRAILISEYENIVEERPWVGWGHANWPLVPGMSSIDNNYLFMALECGIIGVALLVFLLLVTAWRGFATAYFLEGMSSKEKMFRFSLVGAIAVIALSTATVFMGAEVYSLTFLLIGWIQATAKTDAMLLAETFRIASPDENYRLMGVVV